MNKSEFIFWFLAKKLLVLVSKEKLVAFSNINPSFSFEIEESWLNEAQNMSNTAILN